MTGQKRKDKRRTGQAKDRTNEGLDHRRTGQKERSTNEVQDK